jgi:hypothetical protein
MRANEFLTELSVDTGIVKALKAKGYMAPSGIPNAEIPKGEDQMVFMEPGTGLILKIFGTNKSRAADAGSNSLSFPQKTFTLFADYCAANPNNKFLPKFSGWETFEFKGKRYLQIRCERLYTGRNNVAFFNKLADIAKHAEYSKDGAKDYFDEMIHDGYYDVTDYGPLITLIGGEEDFYEFWDTIYQLGKIAYSNGCQLDLHDENFMLNSNGGIVISDPFFSGWSKRDH